MSINLSTHCLPVDTLRMMVCIGHALSLNTLTVGIGHYMYMSTLTCYSCSHTTIQQKKHAGVRPWSEFFNPQYLSRPKGSGDAVKRVLTNVGRFQSNYLFVFLGLVIYCM